MQYFFLTWQAVNRVKILHLAVEAGQTGLKSRGIWFVVIPGALGALFPLLVEPRPAVCNSPWARRAVCGGVEGTAAGVLININKPPQI